MSSNCCEDSPQGFWQCDNSGLQPYFRKAYRNSSSETFPELLSDTHLVPFGIGSAEISETNVIRTKRLAKSAVVISFIEASFSFPVYIDLLDVGATERLTALIEPIALLQSRRQKHKK